MIYLQILIFGLLKTTKSRQHEMICQQDNGVSVRKLYSNISLDHFSLPIKRQNPAENAGCQNNIQF